ncbi:arylamine N-acetyltransferase family protein [Streptomyces sp. NPDC055025]
MFSVAAYLSAIGYPGPPEPGPGTLRDLRDLHKRHLMALPYDNSRLADEVAGGLDGRSVDLDAAFDRAVLAGRGGHCGELAGLFHRLLGELGFDAGFLTAGLRGPGGTFGVDVGHVLVGVRLDGDLWLADVGFAGPGYLAPLRVTEDVQHQYGCAYRIVRSDGYHVVERKALTGDWQALYRFEPRLRALDAWDPRPPEAEADGLGPGTVVRSRAFDNGQSVLLGRRLTRVHNGEEEIRVLIKPADHQAAVDEIMGGGAS